MLHQSPASFCTTYAEAHRNGTAGEFGSESTLDGVSVVSQTPNTARIDALWYTCGHDPESGYYDVFQRTAFDLVKQHDGWHLQAEEIFGYP